MPTYITLNGTSKGETLIGTNPSAQYTINGQSGNDTVVGNALDDVLHGGSGNDYVYGDMITLAAPVILPDFFDFILPLQNMVVTLGGNDVITGDSGNDHLFGEFDFLDSNFKPGSLVASRSARQPPPEPLLALYLS